MTSQAELLASIADRLEAANIPYMVVSRVEFERRITVPLFGRPTPIATAEDTILAKLEWATAGESERQLRDVARIVAVSGDALDVGYLNRWIAELGLEDAWHQVGGDTVP